MCFLVAKLINLIKVEASISEALREEPYVLSFLPAEAYDLEFGIVEGEEGVGFGYAYPCLEAVVGGFGG